MSSRRGHPPTVRCVSRGKLRWPDANKQVILSRNENRILPVFSQHDVVEVSTAIPPLIFAVLRLLLLLLLLLLLYCCASTLCTAGLVNPCTRLACGLQLLGELQLTRQ